MGNKIKWIGEKLEEFVYYYGFEVGIGLICLPIVTDLLFRGAREWNLVSIGVVGVFCQVVGIVLMWAGGRNAK